MTIEQLQVKMEDKLNEFEKKIDHVSQSITKLTNALLGDEFNSGYTQRIKSLEQKAEKFEEFRTRLRYERATAVTIGAALVFIAEIILQLLKI